jgi:hypothetical protein
MAKGKVVPIIDKEAADSKAIEELSAKWHSYHDGAYTRSGLVSAVERICLAAEEMIKSIQGVPFGFTIEDVAPNAINVQESVYDLALALDPGIERTLNLRESVEREFAPPFADRLACYKWNRLSDWQGDARFDTSDAAFQVGILFGAHLVGATPEQITALKNGLIRHRSMTINHK